jgi:hypothetical protein
MSYLAGRVGEKVTLGKIVVSELREIPPKPGFCIVPDAGMRRIHAQFVEVDDLNLRGLPGRKRDIESDIVSFRRKINRFLVGQDCFDAIQVTFFFEDPHMAGLIGRIFDDQPFAVHLNNVGSVGLLAKFAGADNGIPERPPMKGPIQ